jgi:hypothetical protein
MNRAERKHKDKCARRRRSVIKKIRENRILNVFARLRSRRKKFKKNKKVLDK